CLILAVMYYLFLSFMLLHFLLSFLFSFNTPSPTQIYTLSLHDALPIFPNSSSVDAIWTQTNFDDSNWQTGINGIGYETGIYDPRSEEHTSELQSQSNLVCRLLLEKKKKKNKIN